MATVRSIARAPLLICDGCRFVLEPTLVSDNADPNKGLLVHETWQGACQHCKYDFTIIVKQEDPETTALHVPFGVNPFREEES